MGKHEEWRDFLMTLFPTCFRERIPGGTHFDMCIVDMMQFLARMKGEPTFKPKEITERMVRAAFDYSNMDNHTDRPIIDKAVVLLLDTAKNVPKCKAATQMARDGDGDSDESGAIMTKEVYDALIQEMGVRNGDYMIHSDLKKVPVKLTPTMVWRSNNLKWQLNSMIVTALLQHVVVPQHKVLIVDDGVVFGDPDAYRILREKIIEDYHFHEKSAYEKEMLISFIVTHTLTMRYVKHHDGQFKRLPESGIGEADVKFGNYIMRESDGKRNPIRRYLIVSQDTDIPFILLAHMKRMLDPETGKVDSDVEIWVDTQTPSDKGKGFSRSYRYVNIKALYYEIIAFFKEEYPTVTNPIETLLFMVNMLETDFTTRLGHKYLGITRRVVWNVFSETHHEPLTKKDPGYVLFGRQKKDHSKVIHYSQKTHHLLGNDTISVVYDEETTEYRVVLDMIKCEQFLYLLCQQTLVDDMAKLKMIPASTPKFYYPDPDVLLIHTKDLMLSMNAYKYQQKEVQDKSTTALLSGKTFILPQASTQKPTLSKQKSQIGPAISFTPTDTQRTYDKAVMSTLSTKEIPPMYSIPSRGQMKGRIYRLDWVLNYIQNATVSKTFATSCSDPTPLDKEQSRFGWIGKPLDIEGEKNLVNLNSSYHIQSIVPVVLGNMPIRVHATMECDDL